MVFFVRVSTVEFSFGALVDGYAVYFQGPGLYFQEWPMINLSLANVHLFLGPTSLCFLLIYLWSMHSPLLRLIPRKLAMGPTVGAFETKGARLKESAVPSASNNDNVKESSKERHLFDHQTSQTNLNIQV